MIIEFPSYKWKSVDIEVSEKYRHSRTIVTRRPWFRIILTPHQKTLVIGRYRLGAEKVADQPAVPQIDPDA